MHQSHLAKPTYQQDKGEASPKSGELSNREEAMRQATRSPFQETCGGRLGGRRR